MIRAHDLFFGRGGRRLIDAVSLDLKPASMTVVIGPNGAGKSTLLKLLSGELRPDGGQVTLEGADIRGFSARVLAERRAVLPQSLALSFPFTALEIVRMGAVAHGSLSPERDARAALARVGLAGFEARAYQALSGGEQQRVQFARVLAQVPQAVEDGRARTLFLDEPTSSLDIGHQIAVLETARQFARDGGAVLAILHDLNLAAEFADHLVVLHGGRVVAQGAPHETLSDETISSVYGISGAVGRIPAPSIPFVLPQARHG